MDNTKHTQTILSICTGSRGIEKGIERNGVDLRVAAYVEIEAFIIQNLVAQMEQGVLDTAPVWTDIKTFPNEEFYNKIHGIVGGYPCQGESNAGLRKLESDPRYLWPFVRQSIKSIRPLWCFFENVEGHITGTFKYVLRDLRTLGYSVEAGLFTASEVGAPHKRKRIFILGVDHSGCFGLQQKHEISTGRDITEFASEVMGNTQNHNQQHDILTGGSGEIEIGGSSKLLSHTASLGGGKKQANRIIRYHSQEWSAERGQEQFDWEEPRTVKPGLGCTVNGYNFRTDLLRMYGNGVVEQTAELAYRTLWQKQIDNIEKALK